MRPKVYSLILFATIFFHHHTAVDSQAYRSQNFYLPSNLIPLNYDLLVFIDREEQSPYFWGQVQITIHCVKDTNDIVLNAKNLKIRTNQVSVKPIPDSFDSEVDVTSQSYDEERELFIIILDQYLEADKDYAVYIPFFGLPLTDTDDYLLYSYEKDWEGREKQRIIANFGAADASRIFPCFDQLSYKATFKIRIVHPKNVKALTNTESTKRTLVEDNRDLVMDEFAESAPMSTFSLSLALIDFESTEFVDPLTNVPVRIWADGSVIDQMAVPNEMALHAFQFYSRYFNGSLSSQKLDIIAVPKAYDGDTNKYGLISLGDSILPNSTRPADRNFSGVALELCSAISHQWIGPRISTSKSDVYYFFEAFSFFLQKFCYNEVLPDSMSQFFDSRVAITFVQLLMADWDLASQSESESAFNYKGLSGLAKKMYHLIRMMHFLLSDNVFRTGIKTYLTEIENSNSNLDVVWKVFTNLAIDGEIFTNGITVKRIMDPWINEKEYPLIHVTRDEQGTITLKQDRFIFLGEKNEDQPAKDCWLIPLSFTTKQKLEFSNAEVRMWLTCDEESNLTINLKNDEWILFNLNMNVLCRTNYDEKTWKLLQQTLLDKNEYRKIEELTRVHLVSDMFELAEAGILPYETTLDTMKYLSHEESDLVWTVAIVEFNKIYSFLLGTSKLLEQFSNYVMKILESAIKSEQWTEIEKLPQNDRVKTNFKRLIVESACRFGVHSCQLQSLKLFNEWSMNGNPEENNSIPFEIRQVVYCQAIHFGTREQWNFLWQQYEIQTIASIEKDTILKALSCSTTKKKLQKYLRITSSELKFYTKESLTAFSSLSSNVNGYTVMKTFLKQQFQIIKSISQYNEDGHHAVNFGSYLTELFNATTNRVDFNKLNEFMDIIKDRIDVSDDLLQKSIRKATRNVFWLETNQETLSQLLQNYEIVI